MKEYEITPFQWGTGRSDSDQLTSFLFDHTGKRVKTVGADRSADGNSLAVTYEFANGQQLIVTQTRGEEGARRTVNCESEAAEQLKQLGIIPSV